LFKEVKEEGCLPFRELCNGRGRVLIAIKSCNKSWGEGKLGMNAGYDPKSFPEVTCG
jgi:hypothetical protein